MDCTNQVLFDIIKCFHIFDSTKYFFQLYGPYNQFELIDMCKRYWRGIYFSMYTWLHCDVLFILMCHKLSYCLTYSISSTLLSQCQSCSRTSQWELRRTYLSRAYSPTGIKLGTGEFHYCFLLNTQRGFFVGYPQLSYLDLYCFF